jgi:glutathione S-transferase
VRQVSLLGEADKQLGKTTFLAGSAYSIADVMLTAVLQR